MKRLKGLLITICVMVLFVASSASADIVVTPENDATVLVNAIMGSGITVSNITYNGGTAGASGLFINGGDAGLDIASGIVLTSGWASNITSTNTSDSITGSLGLPGDSDLSDLVPGYNTYDAIILAFDFESVGGDVFFNYQFGSDEYNEYTNTPYNDVFGFFLDGVNIALLPDGTPVSINTVNGGNPLGTDATNPHLYNNNDPIPSNGGPYFDFEYDGFTVGFTAHASLLPGTHHIKLAIADAGDSILDSGVFIQAGSFSDEPSDFIPAPGAILLGSIGVALVGWLRRRKTL